LIDDSWPDLRHKASCYAHEALHRRSDTSVANRGSLGPNGDATPEKELMVRRSDPGGRHAKLESEPGRRNPPAARLMTVCGGASVRYRFSLALARFEAPLSAGFVPLGFEAVVG